MIFYPADFSRKPYLTTLFAIGVVAVLALVEALRLPWGALALASASIGFLGLAWSAHLALSYCRALSLRYLVTRDGIVLEDCLGSTIVPIRIIKEVQDGWSSSGKFGKHWLGKTTGRPGSKRPVKLHATRPPDEQLLMVTRGKFDYGISPAEKAAFLTTLEKVKGMGAIRMKEESYIPSRWRSMLPFGDVFFWAFGVTGGIWLVILAFADVVGIGISEKALLGAFIVWVLDVLLGSLLLRKDRTAARLLWLGGLLAVFIAGL